jgi:class 3 adenylate cyclase
VRVRGFSEGMVDTLVSGRDALSRRAWDEALAAFTAADRQRELTPADLQLLAEAAWWAGDPEAAVEALERAYAGHERDGDHPAAAMVAVRLAELAIRALAPSVAAGWIARADGLLDGRPASVAHAWQAFIHAAEALHLRGDTREAIEHAERAIALGDEFDSADVRVQAQAFKGSALLLQGRFREGMALLDEASAAAISGETGPSSACSVYCHTISACRDLGDYRRAGEWADRAERFMRRRAIGGHPGICRVHRAELKRLRGHWPEAEREALQACDELERFRLLDGVGLAHYELGELRLLRGDLDGAEEAFLLAFEYGRPPQPGMSLLQLARGDVAEAAGSVAAALLELSEPTDAGVSTDPLARARLLPAQVEIALAARDPATARRAVEELEDVASRHESPVWDASATTCRAALLLAEGHAADAVPVLDRAWRRWRDLDMPYESARARVLLARARLADGQEATARMELRAARAVFVRLGAAPGVEHVDALLGDETTGAASRSRVVATMMFTDIVTSTDLVGVIGDEAWEDLLHWHDQQLRSVFAEHGGREVTHTGDGFFVVFDAADDAILCAVAIQRRLVEHRHEHGFAPSVRIGIHTALTTREGANYRGRGVHAAARVGALAGAGEIVVSADVLEAAGPPRHPIGDRQRVTLKGIADPVEVARVDWR